MYTVFSWVDLYLKSVKFLFCSVYFKIIRSLPEGAAGPGCSYTLA